MCWRGRAVRWGAQSDGAAQQGFAVVPGLAVDQVGQVLKDVPPLIVVLDGQVQRPAVSLKVERDCYHRAAFLSSPRFLWLPNFRAGALLWSPSFRGADVPQALAERCRAGQQDVVHRVNRVRRGQRPGHGRIAASNPARGSLTCTTGRGSDLGLSSELSKPIMVQKALTMPYYGSEGWGFESLRAR